MLTLVINYKLRFNYVGFGDFPCRTTTHIAYVPKKVFLKKSFPEHPI